MNRGLEALEIIKHTTDLDRPNELNGYANEIAIIEKELKALEIIKNKFVNVMILQRADSIDTYNKYNTKQITEEEFDLLKEVLL